MIPTSIDKSKIPHKPGVYIYKDISGRILYVGKAIDLYSRVASYFNSQDHDSKTTHLVSNIHTLETIIVESEIEALLLEANLIKKHLPPYNIKLTDDKDYLYVKITKETFPKVLTARKQDLADAKKYFGPFPSAGVVRTTLKRLRRVFPWCQNPPRISLSRNSLTRENEKREARNRPCFYYHLGLCPGPCAGKIDSSEYNKIINRFAQFLDGKSVQLIKDLTKEMEKAAKAQNFEQAQRLKKTLEGIGYILQSNKTASYLTNPNFLEDQTTKSLESLQQILKLDSLPERIECFDISNFQGAEATGSMVVLTNGEIDKSQYRRFKIKITGKPNDVGMHQEMLRRRLKHDEWQTPQLIIVDGGIAQVKADKAVLEEYNLEIPIFGLAKREEWLYHPSGQIIKLPKSAMSLRLLQRIRDEAHRFAITYHKKLRSQKFNQFKL